MTAPLRRLGACAALGVLVAAGACEFDATSAPLGRDRPVVHAVLNPVAAEAIILVERSLTGREDVNAERLFDPRDPIVTGNGVPETGATVEVSGGGRTARAVEDVSVSGDGRGRGVYRIRNSRNAGDQNVELVPGTRYTLRITTRSGEVVTGSTYIPAAPPEASQVPIVRFDRDRDTLTLRWARASGAKRYALRVDTPFGPFYLFSDTTAYSLSGGLRNFFADELPHVFVPGFLQSVQVAAVDTNFVDYYRTANDPFTGTGLISRLEGGIGLFGAYVPLSSRVLDVTADNGAAPGGIYDALGTTTPERIELYEESRAGGQALLTGRLFAPSTELYFIVGRLRGEQVTLVALAGESVADTQFVFRGRLAGDTLRGAWESHGEQPQQLSGAYKRR